MSQAAAAGAAFSATVAQWAGFRAALELCSSQFDDHLCLDVTQSGLACFSVDKAQSSYLDAFFPASGSGSIFRSYKLRRQHLSLCLQPKHLARLLKATAGPSKLLTSMALAVGEGEEALTLWLSSLGRQGVSQQATYHLALMEAATGFERVVIDGSEFEFTAEALTQAPAVLCDVIAQLKACGCTEVELGISERRVLLASCGADVPTQCEIELAAHPEGGKLCLAADPPFACSFAFKFFEWVAKLAAVSSKVLLQAGADAPLSVVAELSGGGLVRMYIAPLADMED